MDPSWSLVPKETRIWFYLTRRPCSTTDSWTDPYNPNHVWQVRQTIKEGNVLVSILRQSASLCLSRCFCIALLDQLLRLSGCPRDTLAVQSPTWRRGRGLSFLTQLLTHLTHCQGRILLVFLKVIPKNASVLPQFLLLFYIVFFHWKLIPFPLMSL